MVERLYNCSEEDETRAPLQLAIDDADYEHGHRLNELDFLTDRVPLSSDGRDEERLRLQHGPPHSAGRPWIMDNATRVEVTTWLWCIYHKICWVQTSFFQGDAGWFVQYIRSALSLLLGSAFHAVTFVQPKVHLWTLWSAFRASLAMAQLTFRLLCMAGAVVARSGNASQYQLDQWLKKLRVKGQDPKTHPPDPGQINVSRPSFATAPSICRFATADEYPIRSPMVVADYIISQTAGKSYVEVGTRQGDLFKCIQPYTRHAFAIEMEQNYCHALRRRGIQVACSTFETVADKLLLPVQVFFWFVWPPELSEGWIRRLWSLPRAVGETATVLVGFDGHIPEDMRFLPLLVAHYGGTVERIFFDEGGTVTSRTIPSYAHPQMWRPGRWGVIHVAKFELGAPQLKPLPAPLDVQMKLAIHTHVRTPWGWESHGWKAGEYVRA